MVKNTPTLEAKAAALGEGLLSEGQEEKCMELECSRVLPLAAAVLNSKHTDIPERATATP